MKITSIAFLSILLFASLAISQEAMRDQKIRRIFELQGEINALEEDIMRPDAADVELARKDGFSALRLLPREQYDHVLTTRGGGSYYSFVLKTKKYGQGSDLGLERGRLRVGFAGADYGFIADLGNVPLTSVTVDSPDIAFLVNYQPPTQMAEIRKEQEKTHSYETPSATFTSSVSAMVGHSYALRSLNFDDSDVLVGFKIIRKDTDGSLILLWKILKNFDKPLISREAPRN